MARIAKLLPALLSALLYLSAFPPFNLRFVLFVALVPWLLSLRKVSSRGAFLSGYVMGYVIVLAQMEWTRPLTLRWTGDPLLSPVPWLICAFLGGFYFAILGWAGHSLHRENRLWLFPILWAGVEVVRSCIPGLAFPWFLIATPLAAYPAMIQPAFIGTIYFVGAWVVSMNLMAVCIYERQWKTAALWAMPTLLFLTYSFARYSIPLRGRIVPIEIGQPGVDLAFGNPQTRDYDLYWSIERLFQAAKDDRAALLVLPEGLARDGGTIPPSIPFRIDRTVPVLFGGRRGRGPVYQSAFAFDDGVWSYSDKTRLVVFGEYVPGRNWLPFLQSFNLAGGDLTPGDHVATVKVADMVVGPLICFEGLFWDVAHNQAAEGAQLLATMSIDDWYMGTPAPEQLAMASAWRAIETGLPAVRAASLGISLAVDARGREIARAPVGDRQALLVDVVIPESAGAAPWRPIFPWASSLAWVPFLILKLRKGHSSKSEI